LSQLKSKIESFDGWTIARPRREQEVPQHQNISGVNNKG
jgi:hypothetical protein